MFIVLIHKSFLEIKGHINPSKVGKRVIIIKIVFLNIRYHIKCRGNDNRYFCECISVFLFYSCFLLYISTLSFLQWKNVQQCTLTDLILYSNFIKAWEIFRVLYGCLILKRCFALVIEWVLNLSVITQK